MSEDRPFHALIVGNPFGEVFPPRPEPTIPTSEPRAIALEVLRGYLSELDFSRPGGRRESDGKREEPIAFRVPIENIHVEMPDNVVDLVHPSIAFEEASNGGEHEVIGLTSYLAESTKDKFGKGTVLQVQNGYVENFKLWVFTDEKPMRRAMLSRLMNKLSPTEQMYGIRFRMPEYYDEMVCFTVNRSSRPDDVDSANRRRRGMLEVEMRFNMVALVNAAEVLQIATTVEVESSDEDPLVLDTRVEGLFDPLD